LELSKEQLAYLSHKTGLVVTSLYTKGPQVWVDWGRGIRLMSTYNGTFRIKMLVLRDLPTIAYLIKVKEGWERERELCGIAAKRQIIH
jgi:hypothetical protein